MNICEGGRNLGDKLLKPGVMQPEVSLLAPPPPAGPEGEAPPSCTAASGLGFGVQQVATHIFWGCTRLCLCVCARVREQNFLEQL